MMMYTGSGCASTHVHELLGSVKPADYVCAAHNHRVAAITGPAISVRGGDHVHEVYFGTDSFEGHVHAFAGTTGGAVDVCGGHVHCLEGMVTREGAHRHCFKMVTLINDPVAE